MRPSGKLVGFKVIATTDGGFTVSVAIAEPFNVAAMSELATEVTT